MRAVWTLAVKDLVLLARDRAAMFWVLGFPLFMAFMLGAMFGGSGSKKNDGGDAKYSMPIALVDAERSPESSEFAKRLESSGDVAVTRAPDVAAARRLVLSGDAAAYVVLESDFAGPGMLAGKPPRAQIGFAPSRRAESGMLRGVVLETAAAKLSEAFGAPGGNGGGNGNGHGSGGAFEPVRLTSVEVSAEADSRAVARPATNWEITFPSSILWGLIGCASSFAISLVTERQSGTFFRLKTAPLTRAQILAGKGLACFAMCSVVVGLLLAVGVLALDVRVQNGTGLVLAAVSSALCFTGLMMFLSTLGRTEQATSGMCWGLMTMSAMLGGGMFPLFLMPPWMQTLSNVSPVKWGILALEGGIWRGFSTSDMARPCGVLVGIGVAGFVAGSMILARRDR